MNCGRSSSLEVDCFEGRKGKRELERDLEGRKEGHQHPSTYSSTSSCLYAVCLILQFFAHHAHPFLLVLDYFIPIFYLSIFASFLRFFLTLEPDFSPRFE
ncbi:hypothetical protein BO99DRAFT_249692 [Aspergillus violaceofuscus CBS 115571]|uniref:Transmembrane protein n=1 Tax=Aspergillus violaceofuscus (strain CBS 115571) TaxID=1450538 RepID=A0A2V5GVN2_ASPV1|nr:hypothetical protein BO99DRAFT_249692 [Aspergillus violaceofuscus CBS 115571]